MYQTRNRLISRLGSIYNITFFTQVRNVSDLIN